MDERFAKLFDLRGRTALITGGSSGIGRGMAEALAGAGAHVLLAARRRDALEVTARAFTVQGWQASAEAVDVADRASVVALLARLKDARRHVDILVNAAGINLRMPFEEIGDADWDATLAANLTGPFLLTRGLAPAMAAHGWGRIINVASQQSVRAFGNSGAYGASKGGVMQLTRAQAEAWSGKGVNANAIAPGFFATPLTAAVASDPVKWKANAGRTFIGRNGELPDLAGTAIYLASRASDYVTGQTIFVDGGFSAG